MAKKNRFEKVYTQGSIDVMEMQQKNPPKLSGDFCVINQQAQGRSFPSREVPTC